MHAAFTPTVSKYLNQPNHEIELRLGRVTRNTFDTNVGLDAYQKALSGLKQYQGWEQTKESRDTLYYGQDGKRATMNADTGDVTRMIKKRIEVQDFPLQPFDVRLGISTEIPYEEMADEEVFDETKLRYRHSFIRKNLSIDVSMIKGSPDDLDAEEDLSYQIELEIIDPSAIKDDNELYNLLYKVFDVMKII
jgi:hypothetical protein